MAGIGKKEKSSGMKELQEDILKKQFRRVYLLYGEETYLVLQNRQNLIRAVTGEEDTMNLNIHREEQLDWNAVQDEILSMPFFAPYRMVVLDDTRLFRPARKADSGANKDAGEEDDTSLVDEADTEPGEAEDDSNLSAQAAAFLSRIPDTTVVLFTERPDEKKADGKKKTSVDRRGKLFKAVSKYGLAVEYSAPDEETVKKWVMAKIGAEKIRITRDALDTFLAMVGSDMSHVSAETEKLITYAGPGGAVRTEDVAALTSEILEGKVFRMLDLISQHDRKGALDLYNDLLLLKEKPIKIYSLLVRQLEQLYLAASILEDGGSYSRAVDELGLKQRWQADKVIRQARGFRLTTLREALEECARMQEKAQSGHIDMRLGLEMLILKCSGR